MTAPPDQPLDVASSTISYGEQGKIPEKLSIGLEKAQMRRSRSLAPSLPPLSTSKGGGGRIEGGCWSCTGARTAGLKGGTENLTICL
jgi:hypothetical protein